MKKQSEHNKWQMQFDFGVIQFLQLLWIENTLENCKSFYKIRSLKKVLEMEDPICQLLLRCDHFPIRIREEFLLHCKQDTTLYVGNAFYSQFIKKISSTRFK